MFAPFRIEELWAEPVTAASVAELVNETDEMETDISLAEWDDGDVIQFKFSISSLLSLWCWSPDGSLLLDLVSFDSNKTAFTNISSSILESGNSTLVCFFSVV